MNFAWLWAARRRAPGPTNPWLVGLATAATAAFLVGWGAHSDTALRMWFGIAAGLAGLWLLASAVCWQIRHTGSRHAPATPPAPNQRIEA